jgi:hypothetical protein
VTSLIGASSVFSLCAFSPCGLVEELGDHFVALLLFGLIFFDLVFLRLFLFGEVLVIHFPAHNVLHSRETRQTATPGCRS